MNRNENTEFNSYPHKCACCGEGEISGIHDICLICGWEDDEVQNYEQDFAGGANKDSLNEHREKFKQMRIKKKHYQWCDTWK